MYTLYMNVIDEVFDDIISCMVKFGFESRDAWSWGPQMSKCQILAGQSK